MNRIARNGLVLVLVPEEPYFYKARICHASDMRLQDTNYRRLDSTVDTLTMFIACMMPMHTARDDVSISISC